MWSQKSAKIHVQLRWGMIPYLWNRYHHDISCISALADCTTALDWMYFILQSHLINILWWVFQRDVWTRIFNIWDKNLGPLSWIGDPYNKTSLSRDPVNERKPNYNLISRKYEKCKKKWAKIIWPEGLQSLDCNI